MSQRERNERFVDYLVRVTQQPGPRADLRRCLNKASVDAYWGHRYVAPFVSDGTYPATEEAFYTVAALLAAHGGSAARMNGASNLGDWLGRRVAADGGASGSAVEARLFRIIRMDADDLRPRLHDLIRAGQPKDAPSVPWVPLLSDLCWWDKDPSIAKRWIQGYFRTSQASPSSFVSSTEEATSKGSNQ